MHFKRIFIGAKFDQSHKEVESGRPNQVLSLKFSQLSKHRQLAHGVFTRHGGVSESPYDTLNASYDTDDLPDCVEINLQIIKKAMGAEQLIFMNQVHGKEVLTIRKGHSGDFKEAARVDAIITDRPGLALMVKQADCQAVILFDPVKGVVSNVHCGWRGNAYNILGSVVSRMRSDFGCRESRLMAAIGPSLGPCCAEFVTHEQIFPEKFRQFMVRENFFDLRKVSRWQLLEAGLNEENLEVAGICTGCRTDMFYSYRAEGVTGRFATVAMLKKTTKGVRRKAQGR